MIFFISTLYVVVVVAFVIVLASKKKVMVVVVVVVLPPTPTFLDYVNLWRGFPNPYCPNAYKSLNRFILTDGKQ